MQGGVSTRLVEEGDEDGKCGQFVFHRFVLPQDVCGEIRVGGGDETRRIVAKPSVLVRRAGSPL